MVSIRQQVFEFIKIHPKTTLQETKRRFKECPNNTIGGYYRAYHRIDEKTRKIKDLDIKSELVKIIKDYKQPASARVQAIREYNNLVENKEESSDDSLLTLYKMVENDI